VKGPPAKLERVISATLDKNVDDLVQIENINEPLIVHNLRKRFKNDQIYVLAVSPFSSSFQIVTPFCFRPTLVQF